jgi:hypothetical protein
MTNKLGTFRLKDPSHSRFIQDIHWIEARLRVHKLTAPGGEVVHHSERISVGDQQIHNMGANETSAAGHENARWITQSHADAFVPNHLQNSRYEF